MLRLKFVRSSKHRFIPYLGSLLALLMIFSQPAGADHLLGKHDLQCDKIFPCPDELKPRVKFWIDVFTRHGDDTVILHDSEQPDRVYRVLKTKAQCSRRRDARTIKNAKNKIRQQLRQIADKRGKGTTSFSGELQHLASMFKDEKPSEIRKAAKRIIFL